MSGSPQHWPLHSGAKATATQGTWANLKPFHFTDIYLYSSVLFDSTRLENTWLTAQLWERKENQDTGLRLNPNSTRSPVSPVHQRHQFHLHWQQRSRSREPLCAHRKPNFTLLPCFPAKINTISFKFISPGGLIPQRSLSTKYYYYPNRLSWVIFLFEKKCLEPNVWRIRSHF